MPLPGLESGQAIAPNTLDSWQISKCKASESQPSQKKANRKIKYFPSLSNAESLNL
ncbi:hypothetical protein [Microcoleus anatoxicus]|uniref:Transposase n=1 Tax=Microcoleus anatoxicus PTRS2 TaxID=2705321 RepID=A0ABU8YNJ8_9CYAN